MKTLFKSFIVMLVMAMGTTVTKAESSSIIFSNFDDSSTIEQSYSGVIKRGNQTLMVEMSLKIKNSGEVVGKYRYIKEGVAGKWLGLKGQLIIDEDNEFEAKKFILNEFDEEGNANGIFTFSTDYYNENPSGNYYLNGKSWDVYLY